MKIIFFLSFLSITLAFPSCTSIQYTYGDAKTKVKGVKINSDSKYENYSYIFKHKVHTITAMDTSGTMAAAIATSNNRDTAIRNAIKNNEYSAKWRVHSASEFRDGKTSMGGFIRWSGEDVENQDSFVEGGLIIDGNKNITDSLSIKMIVRMSVYSWKFNKIYDGNSVGEITGGEISLGASLNYYPSFLFGLGAYARTSYNLIDMMAFSFGFNYDAGIVYWYLFTENTSLKIGAKYDHRIRHQMDGASSELYPEVLTNEIGYFISFGHSW